MLTGFWPVVECRVCMCTLLYCADTHMHIEVSRPSLDTGKAWCTHTHTLTGLLVLPTRFYTEPSLVRELVARPRTKNGIEFEAQQLWNDI